MEQASPLIYHYLVSYIFLKIDLTYWHSGVLVYHVLLISRAEVSYDFQVLFYYWTEYRDGLRE